MALPGNPERSLLRFGVFELDLWTGQLHKAGSLINLSPQPFKILVLLASGVIHKCRYIKRFNMLS